MRDGPDDLIERLRAAVIEEQRRETLLRELRELPRQPRNAPRPSHLLLVQILALHLRCGPLCASFDELLALAEVACPELSITARLLRYLLTESQPVAREERWGMVKLRRNLWTHSDTLRRYGLDPATARHSLRAARRLVLEQTRLEGLARLRELARHAIVADGNAANPKRARGRPALADVYATARKARGA